MPSRIRVAPARPVATLWAVAVGGLFLFLVIDVGERTDVDLCCITLSLCMLLKEEAS
jgi:hypothetical protein